MNSAPKDLERATEDYLVKSCKKHGIFILKNTGLRGIPDRLLIKDGKFIFVELKKKGKKPTALQTEIIKRLARHGARTCVIDDKSGVDEIIRKFDDKESEHET